MPTLEELIRPFQSGDVAPPKHGVDNIPNVVPDVVLIVGASGQGKMVSCQSQHTSTVYVIKRPKEKTT